MRILLTGGLVYSPSDPFATAVFIDDGVIAWLGSDVGAEVHAEQADELVDLDGDVLTPSFVDVAYGLRRLPQGVGTGMALCEPLADVRWTEEVLQEAAERGLPLAVVPGPHVPLRTLSRAGVPLVLALAPDKDPWQVVADAVHGTAPGEGITARAAFNAVTRGPWRLAGQPERGALTVGAPADMARWLAERTIVETPDPRISNWSTDPRSATPGLPALDGSVPLPTCRQVWSGGTLVYDVI